MEPTTESPDQPLQGTSVKYFSRDFDYNEHRIQ
jgi:hypothetical protein